MGYRIEYGAGSTRYRHKEWSAMRLAGLTAACLLLFSILTTKYWPEGQARLESLLLPGDPAVTKQAFVDMTGRLRAGDTIGDAVTAFCRDILDGAEGTF